MNRWAAAAACLLMAAATPASAAPLEAPLQAELLALYERYNKSIRAGKLDEALAQRPATVQADAKKSLKTAKQRREMLEMAQAMSPDSLDVHHARLNRAGDKAEIITVAAKAVPKGAKLRNAPPPGTIVRVGLTLEFAKEAGRWKFDNQTFGADPTQIAACKDETNEPADAYNQDRNLTMAGPIIRVDFKPDYTVVVVRVVDEENCTFLPSREELAKNGLEPAKLVPYAIVEIEGSPHRTDKQKVLVDRLTVQDEE